MLHKESSILSFIVGVSIVSLFSVIILGLKYLINSVWVGYEEPYFEILNDLSGLCIILMPAIAGRLWKSKTNAYWIGMIVGLCAVLSILALYAIASSIGTNPV